MLLKEELSKLPSLAANFEMLRTGRHVNESHGRPYYEMLENAAAYETVFAALGYTLISGASDNQRIDFFYFDVPEASDNKSKTSRSLVIVYAALRAYLQSQFAGAGGVGNDLLAIVSGKAPIEFGVVTQMAESVDMAAKLGAYQLNASDVEKVMVDMVRLGFARRDPQKGYFLLPPIARLEQACALIEARLLAAMAEASANT